MEFLANILVAVGAIGAGGYCLVLSRRLRQLNRLEGGMGGAIAVLSLQVDELKGALEASRRSARESEASLREAIEQASGLADRFDQHLDRQAEDLSFSSRRNLRVQRRRVVSEGSDGVHS